MQWVFLQNTNWFNPAGVRFAENMFETVNSSDQIEVGGKKETSLLHEQFQKHRKIYVYAHSRLCFIQMCVLDVLIFKTIA